MSARRSWRTTTARGTAGEQPPASAVRPVAVAHNCPCSCKTLTATTSTRTAGPGPHDRLAEPLRLSRDLPRSCKVLAANYVDTQAGPCPSRCLCASSPPIVARRVVLALQDASGELLRRASARPPPATRVSASSPPTVARRVVLACKTLAANYSSTRSAPLSTRASAPDPGAARIAPARAHAVATHSTPSARRPNARSATLVTRASAARTRLDPSSP